MGYMETRKHRELTDEESAKIYETYHAWRDNNNYQDQDGFCKSAIIDEIKNQDYVLTPGRYVGVEDLEDDGVPFEEKISQITSDLARFQEKSRILEKSINDNLNRLGYGNNK
jgi:type I restriction enzyme M protein